MRMVEELFEISGIVCPWGWDAGNNVTNVRISARGEKDFYVFKDMLGDKLIPLCGKEVTVRGIIETVKGAAILRVISIDALTQSA